MTPIILYYHCLFALGDPPQILDSAREVVNEQMLQYHSSGLTDMASEFHCGVNGGEESEPYVKEHIPEKAKVMYHGLNSRAENLTIVALWEHAKKIEGEAYFLYTHAKGATHAIGSSYGENCSKPWRRGMMQDLVMQWPACLEALSAGNDVVCSHWMWNMADGTQHIPAGNFLWVKASFVRQLPSFNERQRIKDDGISALSSRYEAEVFWGNGPRPVVHQFRPNGGGGVP